MEGAVDEAGVPRGTYLRRPGGAFHVERRL